MSQTTRDQIWNRAAMEGGGDSPGPGDRALSALLFFHGLAMNGGIHHAIEFLNPDQFADAVDGFAYFGFDDMSAWLRSASSDPILMKWTDETELAALTRYATHIPDDDILVARFDAVYRERTAEFAPVEKRTNRTSAPGLNMESGKIIRSVFKYSALAVVLSVSLSLGFLRWESSQPRDDWFNERHGQIETVSTKSAITPYGQLSESVRLTSDSGLRVSFRIIRDENARAPQPVLIVLGGHRTGMDAVDLFGDVGDRTIVGVDYPYGGPEKPRGAIEIARAIPPARQAFLDTVPAISLVLDWLVSQDWVDRQRVVLIGASLGVPFAAAVASRDRRVTGLILVHGAADNRAWMEVQVARRIESEFLHYPLSNILNWLAYGPVFNTGKYVTSISPRPVLIIGARHDERTPAGQSEVLFAAAGDPKRLRYTEGRHIQPDREEIVAELLRITDEELTFLHDSGQ